MTGAFSYHPCVQTPYASGGMGGFGTFGQTGSAIASIVGAVATAGATIYGMSLASKEATHARHQAEREAAAQREAAAAAAAQAEARKIEALANLNAENQAVSGGAPNASGIAASLQGIPTWGWVAGAGGLALLLAWRLRK